MKIVSLKARKILNSSGDWTVECFLELDNKARASASGPSGISTGSAEKENATPEEAIFQIEKEIYSHLSAKKELNQNSLDQILESGPWGANATLAVSTAFAKASNFWQLEPKEEIILPKLMMLVFEGKKHGNPHLKCQEYMIITSGIEEGVEFYQKVKQFLESRKIMTAVGQEGGFSPPEFNDEEILNTLAQNGAEAIAIDAASEPNEINDAFLLRALQNHPIKSIEDPVSENNPVGWKDFYSKAKNLKPEVLIVGDDLVVTDADKITQATNTQLINAAIIKPNQRGTISAGLKAAAAAKQSGAKVIVSHRGSETNDDWIADFALRVEADFVKFGAPARGERIAKYNRLLYLTT